jgi:hypothetical protein
MVSVLSGSIYEKITTAMADVVEQQKNSSRTVLEFFQ